MSNQGLAIFSPFKISLVLGFTLLAWSDLVNGDQTALMAETLVIALYLNDLYLRRDQITRARRLTFSEFIAQIKSDWKAFSFRGWFKDFFDISTHESKRRLLSNLFFISIILSPTLMHLLSLSESAQEGVFIASFVAWSIWFIQSNLKAFAQTKAITRLFFSNVGVYFLLCSLLLVLDY